MAFLKPTFNLLINWWSNATWRSNGPYPPGTAVPPPDATYQGQLRYPQRAPAQFSLTEGYLKADVLFDVGTDVENPVFNSSEYQYWMDVLEVPAGSGRYYFVESTEETGAGFSNEYTHCVACASWVWDGPFLQGSSPRAPYAPAWPSPATGPL